MDAQSSISNPIIEDICRRYASGRVVKTRAEIIAEERARTLERATSNEAESVEIKEDVIESYKNGNEYMTSDAYAEMFRARRSAKHSNTHTNAVTYPTVISEENTEDTVKETYNVRTYGDADMCDGTDFERNTDTEEYCIPTGSGVGDDGISVAAEELRRLHSKKSVASRLRSGISMLFEIVKDWVDYDPKVLRLKRHRKSFPLIAFAAVTVMAVALFLVVSSSVKLMEADSEIAELKSQINEIENTEALLASRLEEKNDLAEIERLASEQLGMIRSEYVSVRFIDGVDSGTRSDGVVSLYKTDNETDKKDNAMIGTLLSALGFGK